MDNEKYDYVVHENCEYDSAKQVERNDDEDNYDEDTDANYKDDGSDDEEEENCDQEEEMIPMKKDTNDKMFLKDNYGRKGRRNRR